MGILFGMQRNDCGKVEDEHLLGLSHATQRYAPDGTFVRGGMRVGMGFQPFHTHQRSVLEVQPISDRLGNRLTFDGRLDNYLELGEILDVPSGAADSAIVLAAFEHWGESCFAKFIGDWALALWSEIDCSLYLARDHAGTRSLYFEQAGDRIVWSTFLETFFVDGTRRALDETYMARYLACQPLQCRTPYEGISMVPAAHYLKFHNGIVTRMPHWRWMVQEEIRYKTDAEYEEHFFALFRQAVERRTGPGAPILAQLSGGMDSSSIVCMSDYIRQNGENGGTDLLDTISFYDEREPELNEMPFVQAVERQRGREGIHLESSYAERTFFPVDRSEGRYLLPGADSSSPARERRLHDSIGLSKYRVMLSGIGGDEVMGGVPTPFPELGDYLISAKVLPFLRKAIAWCLLKRQPLVLMLRDTIQYLARVYKSPAVELDSLPIWCNCGSVVTQSADSFRHAPFLRPSRIENGCTWWVVQETLPHLYPSYKQRHEYRYPFLDRDLSDFLFRIPREQLLRPGQKRSLQRRSLKALLPEEVFNRERKGYASRAISLALQPLVHQLPDLLERSLAVKRGVVNKDRYAAEFRSSATGMGCANAVGLIRFLNFETWVATNGVE
jgi:asparagine synthase (glutamine-hydrolysing)